MPSPFPGMNPYLEGPMWPDIHGSYATELRKRLNRVLPKGLVARIEVTNYAEDTAYISTTAYLEPDVFISESGRDDTQLEDPANAYGATTPPTGTLELAPTKQRKQFTVIVQKSAEQQPAEIICAIEILSPANKVAPGLTTYRKKRTNYLQGGVHLLEIDLIRRGTRPVAIDQSKEATYLVQLVDCHKQRLQFWALALEDRLPTINLPLRPGESVKLYLNAALQTAIEDGRYDDTFDYTIAPAGPALSTNDQQFLEDTRRELKRS